MLCDFGCSQFEEADAGMNTRVGTRLYMPPELLLRKRERKYDHACDLWSLGVMSYVLLCGCPPFPDENEAELNAAIRAAKFDWPPWTDARAAAKGFVRELLQVDPTRRPSADAALRHEWIVQSAARAPQRERRKSSQRDVLAMSASIGEVSVRMRRFTGMARLKKIALNTLARDVSRRERESAPRDLSAARAPLAGAAALALGAHPRPPPTQLTGAKLAHLRTIFERIDADGTGLLSLAEIQDALRETLEAAPDPAASGGDAPASAGRPPSEVEAEITQLMEAMDIDKTNKINYVEVGARARARDTPRSPRAPDTAARAAAVPRGDDDAQHLPQRREPAPRVRPAGRRQLVFHLSREPRRGARVGGSRARGDRRGGHHQRRRDLVRRVPADHGATRGRGVRRR